MSLEGYAGMSEEASRILLEQIMQPGTSSEMVLEHVCAYHFASVIYAPKPIACALGFCVMVLTW
jgi:hypothetical protein